jgi:hypothetical protein
MVKRTVSVSVALKNCNNHFKNNGLSKKIIKISCEVLKIFSRKKKSI